MVDVASRGTETSENPVVGLIFPSACGCALTKLRPMVNQSNNASPFSAKFVCKNRLRNDSTLCRIYGSLSRMKLQHLLVGFSIIRGLYDFFPSMSERFYKF